MKNLLDQTLTACAHCIRSSAAQRTFEQCFPRLTIKTSVGAGREEGEKVALEAPVCVVSIISASTDQNDRTRIPFLGGHSKNSLQHQQRPPLVVLTYHQTGFPDSDNDLALILPILIFSIQINSALDECLSILLKFLHRIRASSVSPPSLQNCNASMYYPTYHRQRLLAGLTGDSQLPQMQVAVVGFVKAIIESLHETKHFRIITLPACL